MLLGGFVDPIGESLADLIVVEVFSSEIGRSGIEVRVTGCVAKLSFGLTWRSHAEVFTRSFKVMGELVVCTCLTSELRTLSVKQATHNLAASPSFVRSSLWRASRWAVIQATSNQEFYPTSPWFTKGRDPKE